MSRGAFVPKANAPLKRRAAPDAQALSPPLGHRFPACRPFPPAFPILRYLRFFMGFHSLHWDGCVGRGQKRGRRPPRSRTKRVETQGGARTASVARREAFAFVESTPRLEAHLLRKAVRWAIFFGLDFLVTFGAMPKVTKKKEN